jgi:hypothetical protein
MLIRPLLTSSRSKGSLIEVGAGAGAAGGALAFALFADSALLFAGALAELLSDAITAAGRRNTATTPARTRIGIRVIFVKPPALLGICIAIPAPGGQSTAQSLEQAPAFIHLK